MNLPEVVGLAEVAEMLGVTRATALNYSERADFPVPFAQLKRGRIWRRPDVDAWAKRTLPLPQGRPRKQAPAGS